MRKFSLFLALVLLAMVAAACIAWTNRENILAHFLSRGLHVPVTIRSLDINKTSAAISRLWIGNPAHSKTTTAFAAEAVNIQATLDQILANPLIIEEIEISNISVGIEFYDEKGADSNWKRILNEDKKKAKSRDYLIHTLILRNLIVEVVQANGKVKRYPTIPQMEFHNIGSATGFPIDEIEKAIFDLMMKNLFQKLQLDQLFKTFVPNLPLPFMGS